MAVGLSGDSTAFRRDFRIRNSQLQLSTVAAAAAASPSTQAFLLVGTLLLLPIIVTYTGWSYWVFRGKVRADVGYGHH